MCFLHLLSYMQRVLSKVAPVRVPVTTVLQGYNTFAINFKFLRLSNPSESQDRQPDRRTGCNNVVPVYHGC